MRMVVCLLPRPTGGLVHCLYWRCFCCWRIPFIAHRTGSGDSACLFIRTSRPNDQCGHFNPFLTDGSKVTNTLNSHSHKRFVKYAHFSGNATIDEATGDLLFEASEESECHGCGEFPGYSFMYYELSGDGYENEQRPP